MLHSELRMAHDRVCTIIVTCCTLHNPTFNLRDQSQGTVTWMIKGVPLTNE